MSPKKKLLAFVFVGSLTVASAQDFTISGVYYNITSAMDATDKTVEIGRTDVNASSCYDGNLVLSSTIGGGDYTITSIGTAAFHGCQTLMSITLPNTITSIEAAAFRICNKLTSVTLPNSITSIEQGTFDRCTKLTSITLPNTLMSIGTNSFTNSGLTSITLPSSITSIGNFSFSSCTSLATVTINKTMPLNISSNVFFGLTLTDLTLKVPMKSISLYENADVWEGFGRTEAIEEEEIEDEPNLNTESHVKENAFSIAIHNDCLEITQEDKALKINRVQIINLLGQVVKTSKENKNSIALSNLPAGVYIVSIATKNGRFSKKFVRE